jgi:hypothetical protein
MLRTRTSKILRLPLLMIVVAALVCISTVQVKSAPKAKLDRRTGWNEEFRRNIIRS